MEEVNEALDKIISINHKIVSFLIEIAKMENEGKAIDEKFIIENNILKTLFEQEQEQYRKIYSEINKYKQSYEENSDFGDIQTVIGSLKEYVILSFQALRYASRNMSVFNEEYGENEQVLEPSIFKGDNYEKFRETELEIIVSNIGKIQERLFFTNNLECLSAFEKENVIVDISEKRFYGDYAVKQTNKYMNDWSIDRIDKTGAAILRMAIYELMYTDTPEVVVINEAIELSKKYSDDNVRKIINAVLDKIIKDR